MLGGLGRGLGGGLLISCLLGMHLACSTGAPKEIERVAESVGTRVEEKDVSKVLR